MEKEMEKSVRVFTSLYERDLLRKPKGTGTWAFSIGDNSAYYDVSKAFLFYGTYANAKKAAQKKAASRGKSVVYVLP